MKKLLIFLVFLIFVAAGAVLLLPQLITPELIKQQLTEHVEKATGRTLKMDGKLALTVFPSLGVEAENVSLSNPPGFAGDAPMLALKRLQVSVALMPLFNKDIQVTRFVLDEPVIKLQVNQAGRANWVFTPARQEVSEEKPAAKAEDKTPPATLQLSDLTVTNANFSYTDEVSNQHFALDKVNATVSAQTLSAPLKVKGDAVWQGKQVAVSAVVDTLAALLEKKPAKLDASVSSELLNVNAKGTLQGENFTLKADAKSSSIKALMTWLKPGDAPIAVPTPLAFSLETDAACKEKRCSLSNLALVLDHVKANGSAAVNMAGSKPVVELDITTNALDLNPFMAAPEKKAGLHIISPAYAQQAPWSTAPIKLDGLKAADVTANVKAPGITFGKLNFGAVPAKAVLKGGRLAVDMAGVQLYEGTGDVTAVADGSGEVPKFELRAKLMNVALEPLLKDASDMDRLAGKAQLEFNASGFGGTQAAIMQNLAGSGQLSVTEGVIKRVNLLEMLRNVSSAFANSNNAAQETRFSRMNGTFSIAQGAITSNDLIIDMPGMRVNGEGNVNLALYTIQYRLSPKTIGQVKDEQGNVTERSGVAVPVIISGSLDNPSFKPDVQSVVKEALSNPEEFKQQLKNSRKDIKEQLKDPKAAVKNIKNMLKF